MRGLPNEQPPRRSLRQWVREMFCGHVWHEVYESSGRHWYECNRCKRTEW